MSSARKLIAADPEVYYVTDHYVKYPNVLVRVSRIHRDSLRDLLDMAMKFAIDASKPRKRSVKGVRH